MKKKHVLILSLLFAAAVVCCIIFYNINKPDGGIAGQVNTNQPDDEQIEEEDNELSIYTIDYDNQETMPSVIVVPENTVVDTDFILSEVQANFKEKANILYTEEYDDSICIYFDNDSPPLKGVSEKMEEAMLNCLAYSLIDNIGFCEKVYFRTNKGKYDGVSISLEEDEPYITR